MLQSNIASCFSQDLEEEKRKEEEEKKTVIWLAIKGIRLECEGYTILSLEYEEGLNDTLTAVVDLRFFFSTVFVTSSDSVFKYLQLVFNHSLSTL